VKDFCVVGSGISGSTIANLLSKKNTVEVFDKARGPGGRASNRRFKTKLSFDHGLQYISPKTKEFKNFILELKRKKIIKEWNGDHLDLTLKKKPVSKKYIGIKGNNDICKYLIKNIKCNFLSTVTNIKFNFNYWTITLNNKSKINFKKLILTCPYPQLKKISSKYLSKKMLNLKPQMQPNITVMVAYKQNKNIPISSIKFNDQIIAWASQENTKNRFKSTQSLWTIQCTGIFSKKINNLFKKDKKKYQLFILKRFEELTGFQVKNATFQNIHGWKYAFSLNSTNISSTWLSKYRLGVCADWFEGSKAEDAWFSAKSLYKGIKKNPYKNIRV
jgi:predicted NAD/FAD-dependent oxidoreductase